MPKEYYSYVLVVFDYTKPLELTNPDYSQVFGEKINLVFNTFFVDYLNRLGFENWILVIV
jgi:hypothetical protein